jgi:hypothetical protein
MFVLRFVWATQQAIQRFRIFLHHVDEPGDLLLCECARTNSGLKAGRKRASNDSF